MAYADAAAVEAYVPSALVELWGGDTDALDDSLDRAYREINESLGGLDRFDAADIPVPKEDDDKFPEALIKLNAYTAVYQRISGIAAGELFEDHWRWLRSAINRIWSGIENGEYRFGADPEDASAGSKRVELGRSSP